MRDFSWVLLLRKRFQIVLENNKLRIIERLLRLRRHAPLAHSVDCFLRLLSIADPMPKLVEQLGRFVVCNCLRASRVTASAALLREFLTRVRSSIARLMILIDCFS